MPLLQVASCHLTGTRPISVSSCCEERWTLGWAKCWTARVVKRTQAGSFCDVAGAHATLCMGARRNDHAGLRRRYLLHQHGGGSGRVRTSASTRLRTLTGRLTTANVATFSKPEHLARFERGARLLAGLTMLLNRPTGRQAASQARQVAFVVLSGHSRSKHQARQGPRTESRTAGCDSSPQLLARRSRRPTQAVERLEIS